MKKYIIVFISLIAFGCNENQTQLEYSDLIEKNPEELRIMRNEIFAKHGYIFISNDLREHFSSMDWYEPRYKNVDSLLTEIDKNNIEIIIKAENYLESLSLKAKFIKKYSAITDGENFFPLKLQDIIKKLGTPDSSIIDTDEFCPIGQLHFWNNDFEKIEFIVLGDSYGEPINYETKSRIIAFKLKNHEIKSSYSLLNGIFLGDSKKDTEKKITDFVKTNSDFKTDEYQGKTLVDNFLTHDFESGILITNNKIFLHLVFEKDDKLRYIVKSDFDIRLAC
jgi:hypothetical protein